MQKIEKSIENISIKLQFAIAQSNTQLCPNYTDKSQRVFADLLMLFVDKKCLLKQQNQLRIFEFIIHRFTTLALASIQAA